MAIPSSGTRQTQHLPATCTPHPLLIQSLTATHLSLRVTSSGSATCCYDTDACKRLDSIMEPIWHRAVVPVQYEDQVASCACKLAYAQNAVCKGLGAPCCNTCLQACTLNPSGANPMELACCAATAGQQARCTVTHVRSGCQQRLTCTQGN